MIYDINDMAKAPLYAETMENINDLHDRLGCPEEFEEGENRKSTTGNSRREFWKAGCIGDWEGDEGKVAEALNQQLGVVYQGLELMGNGGIYSYYASEAWREFVDRAEELIDDYNACEAFSDVCNNPGLAEAQNGK